jgi:hypothetical protein
MPPNSVGRLSSLAAIRELTAALELTDWYLVARAGQRTLATFASSKQAKIDRL